MTREESWLELSALISSARSLASRLEESSEVMEGVPGLCLTSAERVARDVVSWLEISLDALDSEVRDDDDGATWQEWPEDADCQGAVR